MQGFGRKFGRKVLPMSEAYVEFAGLRHFFFFVMKLDLELQPKLYVGLLCLTVLV